MKAFYPSSDPYPPSGGPVGMESSESSAGQLEWVERVVLLCVDEITNRICSCRRWMVALSCWLLFRSTIRPIPSPRYIPSTQSTPQTAFIWTM